MCISDSPKPTCLYSNNTFLGIFIWILYFIYCEYHHKEVTPQLGVPKMTLGLMISLERFTEFNKVTIVNGVSQKFICVFLYHLTENLNELFGQLNMIYHNKKGYTLKLAKVEGNLEHSPGEARCKIFCSLRTIWQHSLSATCVTKCMKQCQPENSLELWCPGDFYDSVSRHETPMWLILVI